MRPRCCTLKTETRPRRSTFKTEMRRDVPIKRIETAVSQFENTNWWSLSLHKLFLRVRSASLMHCMHVHKTKVTRPRRDVISSRPRRLTRPRRSRPRLHPCDTVTNSCGSTWQNLTRILLYVSHWQFNYQSAGTAQNFCLPNDWRKRWDLVSCRNVSQYIATSEEAAVVCGGRLFHSQMLKCARYSSPVVHLYSM